MAAGGHFENFKCPYLCAAVRGLIDEKIMRVQYVLDWP